MNQRSVITSNALSAYGLWRDCYAIFLGIRAFRPIVSNFLKQIFLNTQRLIDESRKRPEKKEKIL